MTLRGAIAISVLACVGCTKKEPARAPGPVHVVETDVSGLSGLGRDEHGAFWSPGEGADAVVRVDPGTFAVTRYPIVGAPEGTDLEALAWIDGTRFILGTETQVKGRTRDVILDGRLEGERFRVAPVGYLEYAHWGITAPNNDGIEGICHADGVMILATELAEGDGVRRWAPLATFDLRTQVWTAHRVALTSAEGKLSAIDCRARPGGIEVLAVERHFGVSRLLRFDVPRGPEGQRLEPRVVADLAKLVAPLPNFEGLAWLEDGSAVLLNDNKYRGAVTEPSRLYFIPASAIR